MSNMKDPPPVIVQIDNERIKLYPFRDGTFDLNPIYLLSPWMKGEGLLEAFTEEFEEINFKVLLGFCCLACPLFALKIIENPDEVIKITSSNHPWETSL